MYISEEQDNSGAKLRSVCVLPGQRVFKERQNNMIYLRILDFKLEDKYFGLEEYWNSSA